MKKVFFALCVVFAALFGTAYAAELSLTEFSVSGSHITVKGYINEDAQNRASIFVQQGSECVYINSAVTDFKGNFDLSFDAPGGFKAGNLTAYVGGSNIKNAKSVSFSYPNDRVYIKETRPSDDEPKTNSGVDMSASKTVSRVVVSGKVKNIETTDDKVMLVVKKADSGVNPNESDIAYIDQGSLLSDGSFSFSFNFVGNLSEYKAYLYADGKNVSDSITVAHSKYEYVTAEISLTRNITRAEALAKLNNGGDETVPYILLIAAYDEKNVMVALDVSESKAGVGNSSSSATMEIPENAVKVKAMLWNSREEMLPIADPQVFIP